MQSTVPIGVDLMNMQNNTTNNIFTGVENNHFQSTLFVKDQVPLGALTELMNFRRIANETPSNFSLNIPITAINSVTPSHKRKSSTSSNQSTDTTPDVRSQPTRKRKSKLTPNPTPTPGETITIPITLPNHNNSNNTNNGNTSISVSPASTSPLSFTTTTTSSSPIRGQNQSGIHSSQEILAEKEEGASASAGGSGSGASTGMVAIGGKLYHESQLDSIDESTLTVDERKQLKKQRRLVKNREAAQLFRQRQKEYIVNLERRAAELTQANHEASARVELLSSENKLMKEQLVYLRNFMKQAVSFSFPFDPKVMGFTPFQSQTTLTPHPSPNTNNAVSTPPISINSPIHIDSSTNIDTPLTSTQTNINNNFSPMPIMSVSGSMHGVEGESSNNQPQSINEIPKDQNPLYPD
eukprot:TRINITY_DN950_c0_g3_i1.p1 TRINITY_DN950_c0_g3~~TRINITY_DN950_c0_g3_i1.p1  ORF type:complete len:410 (+),score=108.35 TRINITY_DN950_c0_g3_i1:246-1475(+)